MFKRALLLTMLLAVASPAFGFALLGPYTDWMTWSNGYRRPWQLGGPMNIDAEYRWNLPVITYGFDSEFIEYFGQDGMDAVTSAIGMLTNLPPVSEITLEDYPFRTLQRNQPAFLLILDLKTISLQCVLAQLGLAEPGSSMWTIRERNGDSNTVILRNFDPETLLPTNMLNSVLCTYWIYSYPDGAPVAHATPEDPSAISFPAAADDVREAGSFRYALSRDDVGGLRYLYSRTNINIEPSPSDVTLVGQTNRPIPDIAARPGIEKITFQPMLWNTYAGKFNSVTSVFDLFYVTNGVTHTQSVQRIVTTPDIVFEARDLGGSGGRTDWGDYYFSPFVLQSTDTTRWQNLSHLNNSDGDGPGVIPPGARITFSKAGKYSQLGYYSSFDWASLDGSNAPVIFPGHERVTTVTLDNYIQREGTNAYFTTVLLGTTGAVYQIDTSTNLIHWTPFTTITNDQNPYGGYFSLRDKVSASNKFYRAIRRD